MSKASNGFKPGPCLGCDRYKCACEPIRKEITDTDRLEWLIKNRILVLGGETNGYYCTRLQYATWLYFKTPREAIDEAIGEAIDAAMEEEKKK